MNVRRIKIVRASLGALAVGAVAVALVGGPQASIAMAAKLVDSGAVRDNSLQSVDVRNNSLRGVDILDGSLSARDFSGSLRGPAGPRGLPGTPGTNGKDAGPDEIVTYTVDYHEGDEQPPYTVLSNDIVPAHTQIEVLDLEVTGDFGACTDVGALRLGTTGLGSGGLADAERFPSSHSWSFGSDSPVITFEDSRLRVRSECFAAEVGPVPAPSYTLTATLAFTKRDVTPTGTFD